MLMHLCTVKCPQVFSGSEHYSRAAGSISYLERNINVAYADVPAQVELPVAPVLHDSMNTMPRDLQNQLRRKVYNFEAADAVLTQRGIRISRQNKISIKSGNANNGKQPQTPTTQENISPDWAQGGSKQAKASAVQENTGPTQAQKGIKRDLSSPEEEQHPSKRACADSPPSTFQEAAQAADAAAAAEAENILHVPSEPAIAAVAGQPGPQATNQATADLLGPTLPPDALSDTSDKPPTSQTSLAAAAAAAISEPSSTAPADATQAPDGKSSVEQAAPAPGDQEAARAPSCQADAQAPGDQQPSQALSGQLPGKSISSGTTALNGHANGSLQEGNEPVLLYDINRLLSCPKHFPSQTFQQRSW